MRYILGSHKVWLAAKKKLIILLYDHSLLHYLAQFTFLEDMKEFICHIIGRGHKIEWLSDRLMILNSIKYLEYRGIIRFYRHFEQFRDFIDL